MRVPTFAVKEAARRAVTNAVKRGTLVRPDHCAQCGRPCHPDAHHPDYLKPLAVEWLCTGCHGIAHSGNGVGTRRGPKPVFRKPKRLTVMLDGKAMRAVDAFARDQSLSRSKAARRLLDAGLRAEGGAT